MPFGPQPRTRRQASQAFWLHLAITAEECGLPTGPTTPREDVDQVIAASQAAGTGSAEPRAFPAEYPAKPIALQMRQ
jgi:hypothetical protein